MIKVKHIDTKHLGPAPKKHLEEPWAKDLTVLSYKGLGVAESEPLVQEARKVPLYPISWGWNADGRAGNATMREIRKPQLVHRSTMRNYISSSAGTHHSLLVSDQGVVYSFGSGRRGQLGFFPNEFKGQIGGNVKGPKGGIQQTLPRAVIGTGTLVFGTDLKIGQVCAGRFSSIARQISTQEGIASVKTLMDTKRHLEDLMKYYPDSVDLQQAWALCRHEIYKTMVISHGQLTSWGKGDNGELGLGRYVKYNPSPAIIPRLRRTVVTQVAMGPHHVLAVDHEKRLYTWGSGAFGKLGHGDFYNRYSPNVVEFFDRYNVEFVAAGDNHSACLTTTRKSEGTKKVVQINRVSCWGKGAHGRLGYGGNYLSKVPKLVDEWPPSMADCQFVSLACGGAHTIVLGYRLVEKCLVFQQGIQTFLCAWGYGTNGQLGNGYAEDSFLPKRVRFQAKNELIVEIAAGRSWSMARSYTGELWTWGKGLRGQLGQGKHKFSLVPRKVGTFTSFLKLDSGFGHSTCLSTSKKIFREVMAESTNEGVDVFKSLVPLTLKKRESESLYQFDCCVAGLHPQRAKLRYICKTCNIHSICVGCRALCHARCEVVERLDQTEEEMRAIEKKKKKKKMKKKAKIKIKKGKKGDPIKTRAAEKLTTITLRKMLKASGKKVHEHVDLMEVKMQVSRRSYERDMEALKRRKVPYCACSMCNPYCRRMPSIVEEEGSILDDDGDGQAVVPKIEAVRGKRAIDLFTLDIAMRREQAAMRIQRQAQWYINRQHLKKIKEKISELRYEASTMHWEESILGPIWRKLDRARSAFREKREMQEMQIEDVTKHKYDYSRDLQRAVGVSNSIMFGIEKVIGKMSPQLPAVKKGKVRKKEPTSPTFAWTVASIRQQQLKLHPSQRLSTAEFTDLTSALPRGSRGDGKLRSDPDLWLYFERYMQDLRTVTWRDHYNWIVAEKKRIREEAVAAARKVLMKQRFGAAQAIEDAKRLIEEKNGSKKPPAPPPGPPPEEQERDADLYEESEDGGQSLSPDVLSDSDLEERQERGSRPETGDADQGDNSNSFDVFEDVKQTHNLIRRRNSIVHAQGMFNRIVTEAPPKLLLQGIIKRRNSLPARMSELYVPEKPDRESLQGAIDSLELFALRLKVIGDYADPQRSALWDVMEPRPRNKRTKRLMGYAYFNPRLPLEMHRILTNGGRRRTIGEPERLAKQSHMMLEQRNFFVKGRERASNKQKMTFRRRSFDLGEWRDEKAGILDILGYPTDPPHDWRTPTMSDTRRDSALMENRMIFAGVLKQENKTQEEGPDFSGFEAKAVVEQKLEEAPLTLHEQEKKRSMAKGNWAASRKPTNTAAAAEKKRDMEVALIWQEFFSESGETYYYNPSTQESTWDYPQGPGVQVVSQYQDDDGNYYWYNFVTGESTWA